MGEERDDTGTGRRTDRELIEAFREGDESAFDELVVRYQHRIFNLCYRFMSDREEANDCAQETFIKMYRSVGRFRFRSAFSTWVYRVAANPCKNRLASSQYRHARDTVRIDNPGRGDEESPGMEIGDESFSPRAALEKKEARELVQQAIRELPDEQKEVLLLRDIEGCSYEEISQVIGCSLGTVKSKLARARMRLKDVLKGMM